MSSLACEILKNLDSFGELGISKFKTIEFLYISPNLLIPFFERIL